MLVNAVFEGGGVKAIGLAGAVAEAQRRGVEFHRVAGTSSGSIIAALLAAGYTGEEVRRLIEQTPFSAFLQKSLAHRIRWIGPVLRILVKKGLYAGDMLEQWVAGVLLAKGIRTFSDFRPGQVKIIASDISNGRLLVLPDDFAKFGLDPGRMTVARAVRMSTSIPYFFDPVVVRANGPFTYVVDGGLLSNFPLWLFDEKKETPAKPVPTLGFQLVGRSIKEPNRIYGPLSMLHALFSTMADAHDERYIEDHNRVRTIKIPTLGVRTTQFDIDPALSKKLYESGVNAADKFFRSWKHSRELLPRTTIV